MSKEFFFVLGFGVCFKMEFDLGLGFLKKIFLFWGTSTNVQKWVCACGVYVCSIQDGGYVSGDV